jgi:hypothetical protein
VTLEEYLDSVVATVGRVGPPENPTLFATGKKNDVALLAGDFPDVAAKEFIRMQKPKMIVLTIQFANMPLVVFQAESKTQQIFCTYRLDPWQPVAAEINRTSFGNLIYAG